MMNLKKITTGIVVAIFSLFLLVGFGASATASNYKPEKTSFKKAKPVWAIHREYEKNLTLSFRQIIDVKESAKTSVRLAASCDYRLRVNGEFVSHGPCVAAHGFYRVDEIDITPYLKSGKNLIALEVAGYNEQSFYLLSQPSFLQAEIISGGNVIAWTGRDFEAYDLKYRRKDVAKLSFQRPYMEYYTMNAATDDWWLKPEWTGTKKVKLAEQEKKTLITRNVAYPDYTVHSASPCSEGVYKFDCNSTGFVGIDISVSTPTKIEFNFDELLAANGHVSSRMSFRGYFVYELQPGEYRLETFEPYTMQYIEPIVKSGDCEIKSIWMRDYCGSGVDKAKFDCSDKDLCRIFEAARETHRQNALDIFMDCPSRERAGWLCDSYFTSRVNVELTGNTLIEKNFLENFLLPDKFPDLPEGMLPMCYPSDIAFNRPASPYIPNWAMWYVVELEEYLYRSGDVKLVRQAKNRVYALVDFFDSYLNEDGLLEDLDAWVFVEWSFANSCVNGVNYPSNALYAEMLACVGRMYNDKELIKRSENIKATIRNQSYDGEFFCDNSLRDSSGKLVRTNNRTEACQYYLFHLGVASPETYPELWNKLVTEFGPKRTKDNNPYPSVHFANAFIGNYLRLECLSKAGLSRQIVEENEDFFLPMVEQTGTLWENMTAAASCNHGFASHLIHVLYRDILGAYDIDRVGKKVTLRFIDSGLESCSGVIPVKEGNIELSWTRSKDGSDFKYDISLPKGWTSAIYQ